MDNINKLLLHPSFKDTVDEINRLNIRLPQNPSEQDMDFSLYTYPTDGELVSTAEDIKSHKLDAKNGEKLAHDDIRMCAYDESVNKFDGLEGAGYLTSHSLIVHHKDDYLPSNLLTFYFYTRASTYTDDSCHIIHSQNPEADNSKNYVKDRTKFILDNIPNNSIIFIDGPLIGGQVSTYTTHMNKELLAKNVIPLFFVKNSTSNLVTDNIKEIKGKYNSDMHWAYKTLRMGERTNLFRYVDKYNDKNAKMFCYFKAFDRSPQRFEIHLDTYIRYHDKIPELIDLAYYLLLVQGDLKNPQIRSIAIAEKYARATLKAIDLNTLMKKIGVTPTMNEERFGR